jgi:release factor glutamine methyltransferase
MTVDSYLKSSLTLLKSNNVDTARLDTLVLMEHVLGINRAKLLVELDMEISPKHIKVLDQLVNKRAMHIPIAQLLNRAEFYGRLFQIDESVLVPRPESETIIDLLLELTKSDQYLSNKLISGPDLNRQKDGESSMRFSTRSLRIADVGTGSGALGITAKLELKNVEIDLIDSQK